MNKHWKNIQASVNSKFANPFFCHKKVFLSRVALSLAEMFAPGYTIRLFQIMFFILFQNALKFRKYSMLE